MLVGNPFEVEFVTIDSIIEKLRAKAQQTPPGTWVEGYFFDDTKVKDKRAAERARPRRGVDSSIRSSCSHRGGHTSFYNSKALEMAGVTKEDAESGRRNVRSRREGRAERPRHRHARARVQQRRQATDVHAAEQTAQRERDGIAHISKQFVRYGLTSVHHEGGDLSAIQEVRARGELLHRVSYESSGRVLDSMITGGIRPGSATSGSSSARPRSTRSTARSPSARWRSASRTRACSRDTRQHHRNAGRPQRVDRARASRRHPGELSRERRRGDRHVPDGGRARAEAVSARGHAPQDHALHAHQRRTRARIKALGAVPAMFTTYAYYNSDKFVFYGEDLMKRSMAYRTFIDAGVWAAAGSDFSPGRSRR